MSLFLTAEDLAELTGIRAGKGGKSREQRQVDTLRQMKIPHYVNAAGRPVVARAVIEGGALRSGFDGLEYRPTRPMCRSSNHGRKAVIGYSNNGPIPASAVSDAFRAIPNFRGEK